MVHGDAVDDRSSPVVAAKDDGGEAEVGGEGGDVVGSAFIGVVVDRLRGVCSPVTHHIWGHNTEA